MGVCANARGVITKAGWLAVAWLAACVSTSIPEPARGSPLSPHAEAAPVMPVATSLTHDPLATLPEPAHHDHQHHHHAEQPAAHGGGMAEQSAHEHEHADAAPAPMRPASPAHGQRAARAPERPAPAGGAPAADGGAQTANEVYVCPMHPDVRQSTPGTCPRCGMKLVPAPKDPKPQPHEHHGE